MAGLPVAGKVSRYMVLYLVLYVYLLRICLPSLVLGALDTIHPTLTELVARQPSHSDLSSPRPALRRKRDYDAVPINTGVFTFTHYFSRGHVFLSPVLGRCCRKGLIQTHPILPE